MDPNWLQRNVHWVVGGLSLALVAAFALIGALFLRLEDTRSDLERVEAGALLASAQLQLFRDQLIELGPTVSTGLDEAVAGLESFGESSLEFDVRIDQDVAVDTSIAIDREFTVPIDTTIPINQTIETTIDVQGPLGVSVPVDVAVPIALDVPVVLDLTFVIEESIPLATTIPVHLELPVEIDVADTGLADLSDSLAEGLIGFQEAFAGLTG